MAATLSPKKHQGYLLYSDLLDQLNPKHPLMILAKKIPWHDLEKQFLCFYSDIGRPAKPVRLMIGLTFLKYFKNLSDDRVVELWVESPYVQAFCGETRFRWDMPCEPSDLTHFRNRIGDKGAEILLKLSIDLHGEKAKEPVLIVDTTVQEKNITFPTDTKTWKKSIERCWKLAKKAGVNLRRSYGREIKSLLRIIRFERSQNADKVEAAKEKLKKIANTLLNEIERKLPANFKLEYQDKINLYRRAINQKKDDKNKIYSLHEPQVVCIAKGKERIKYEFGSKVAIAVTSKSGIIVGAKNFTDNVYDGHTLPDLLAQVAKMTGQNPKEAVCDRGFRGKKFVENTEIHIPDNASAKTTSYKKRKAKKNFGRRSAIEPIIGHLKSDYRLARNFLKGTVGDAINLLLGVVAFNIRKFLRETAARLCDLFFNFFLFLLCFYKFA